MSAKWSRRAMLETCSTGFGSVALAGLMNQSASASDSPGGAGPAQTHHPPQAKHVIFCFMSDSPDCVHTIGLWRGICS